MNYIYIQISFGIIICLIIIIIYLQIRYYKLTNTKKEIEEKLFVLKLNSKNTKLNPHFIFNTLNNLCNLFLTEKQDDALIYVSNLGKLLRTLYRTDSKFFHSLEREIDFVKNYLSIEQIRFKDQLIYEISAQPNMDLKETYIPQFLIHTFVDNAFKHGILAGRGNQINIVLSQDKIYSYILIQDNGIGINKIRRQRGNSAVGITEMGSGLRLTTQLIKMLNKKRKNSFYTVEIEDISERSNGKGTNIKIQVPRDIDWIF